MVNMTSNEMDFTQFAASSGALGLGDTPVEELISTGSPSLSPDGGSRLYRFNWYVRAGAKSGRRSGHVAS